MKYTIIPAAVMLCGVLTGCSAERPAVRTTPVISAEAAEKPAKKSERTGELPEVKSRENSITVKYLGHEQTIPLEKEVHDYNVKTGDDYNFDGFNDLFIPYENEKISRGEYWLWEPEKQEFVKSDAFFPDDSRAYYVKPEQKTKLLNAVYDRRTVSFEWKEGKLIPAGMKQSFINDKVKLTDNVYGFDDEYNIILRERRYYSDATEECCKTEPAADYLRVTDSALEYMKDSSVVQTIPLEDIFSPDAPPAVKDYLPGCADRAYGIQFTRLDLDNDGDRDLCIVLKPEGAETKRYVYYRYDDKADKFTEWEELTADGKKYVTGHEDEQAYFTEYKLDADNHPIRSYYHHGDNGPVLFRRVFKTRKAPNPQDTADGDNRNEQSEEENRLIIFTYDENGNETIVSE